MDQEQIASFILFYAFLNDSFDYHVNFHGVVNGPFNKRAFHNHSNQKIQIVRKRTC